MTDREYVEWRANIRARGAVKRARRKWFVYAIALVALGAGLGYTLRPAPPKFSPEIYFDELVRVYGRADAKSIWLERGYALPHPSVWGDVAGEPSGPVSD